MEADSNISTPPGEVENAASSHLRVTRPVRPRTAVLDPEVGVLCNKCKFLYARRAVCSSKRFVASFNCFIDSSKRFCNSSQKLYSLLSTLLWRILALVCVFGFLSVVHERRRVRPHEFLEDRERDEVAVGRVHFLEEFDGRVLDCEKNGFLLVERRGLVVRLVVVAIDFASFRIVVVVLLLLLRLFDTHERTVLSNERRGTL